MGLLTGALRFSTEKREVLTFSLRAYVFAQVMRRAWLFGNVETAVRRNVWWSEPGTVKLSFFANHLLQVFGVFRQSVIFWFDFQFRIGELIKHTDQPP